MTGPLNVEAGAAVNGIAEGKESQSLIEMGVKRKSG